MLAFDEQLATELRCHRSFMSSLETMSTMVVTSNEENNLLRTNSFGTRRTYGMADFEHASNDALVKLANGLLWKLIRGTFSQ
jgi:hypothetical protein